MAWRQNNLSKRNGDLHSGGVWTWGRGTCGTGIIARVNFTWLSLSSRILRSQFASWACLHLPKAVECTRLGTMAHQAFHTSLSAHSWRGSPWSLLMHPGRMRVKWGHSSVYCCLSMVWTTAPKWLSHLPRRFTVREYLPLNQEWWF